jgi:hypothetical protein
VTRLGAAVSIVLLAASVLFTQESVASDGGVAEAARSAVNIPTLTGPVSGGHGQPSLITTSFDLADVGYTGAEYFLEGNATAYSSAQPLTSDGRWSVTPQASAPYKTRVVVYRPKRAAQFNGTVFVEWLNVSPGRDNAPEWGSGHNAIIGDGAAWIGVSAQRAGLESAKSADTERYSSLAHPGDSYSYDIYSQAAAAARNRTALPVLGPLRVKHVIGIGESQSAWRMVTFIDGVQPLTGAYDGFLVHSSMARGASLASAPLTPAVAPAPTLIRDDLDVPVFVLQTETDVAFGAYATRRRDTERYRLWEVAGASHADFYQGTTGFADVGDGQAERTLLDMSAVAGGPLRCAEPINYGPQYLVLEAALHHLGRWVAAGVAPPRAVALDVSAGPPVTINRDEHGNARGGVRTPLVDVPIARLDGATNAGGTFCFLFGHTVPFDAAKLATLYPTRRAYVSAFTKATRAAERRGFILPARARNLERAAAATNF